MEAIVPESSVPTFHMSHCAAGGREVRRVQQRGNLGAPPGTRSVQSSWIRALEGVCVLHLVAEPLDVQAAGGPGYVPGSSQVPCGLRCPFAEFPTKGQWWVRLTSCAVCSLGKWSEFRLGFLGSLRSDVALRWRTLAWFP